LLPPPPFKRKEIVVNEVVYVDGISLPRNHMGENQAKKDFLNE